MNSEGIKYFKIKLGVTETYFYYSVIAKNNQNLPSFD